MLKKTKSKGKTWNLIFGKGGKGDVSLKGDNFFLVSFKEAAWYCWLSVNSLLCPFLVLIFGRTLTLTFAMTLVLFALSCLLNESAYLFILDIEFYSNLCVNSDWLMVGTSQSYEWNVLRYTDFLHSSLSAEPFRDPSLWLSHLLAWLEKD